MTTQSIFLQCTKCTSKTAHEIVFESTQILDRETLDGGDMHGKIIVVNGYRYIVYRCLGCKSVALQRSFFNSDLTPGEYDHDCKTFPPIETRKRPEWLKQLDSNSQELFNETYNALFSGSNRLAAMGARALIDDYITRQVGDQGNFTNGLTKLVAESIIDEEKCKIVKAAVDAGNASVHRAYCPNNENLNIVLDIVENLIESEILKQAAEILKRNTPERKSAPKDQTKNKS